MEGGVIPRIQEGDRVRHCDGREGICLSNLAENAGGYPIAEIQWETGERERVKHGYLEVIPGVKVTP